MARERQHKWECDVTKCGTLQIIPEVLQKIEWPNGWRIFQVWKSDDSTSACTYYLCPDHVREFYALLQGKKQ